jgi:fermentation-respiration switch protein FrsA (DUF1100 family)
MKPLILWILFPVLFLATCIHSHAQTSTKAHGNWSGKLQLPTGTIEIIFMISEDENGSLSSKLDVPVQGAKDVPVSKTLATADSLTLTVDLIVGKFTGKFENDTLISGTWCQRGMNLPLTLKKTATVTEIKRPQTPRPPFPYLTEDVEYVNPVSGLKLAGTLTLPANKKNYPAVILISGSGAQDRDETIFEHRPFLVIADFLTRHGIAVLRVDDRGVGGSEGNIREATSEDFAGDVLAGIDFLRTRKEINKNKIGLIGHSEGGLIAPIVASKSKDVVFIVLLAGPGINGEQILYKQNDLSLSAAGMGQEIIDKNRKLQKTIFDIILNEKDSTKQIDRLQRTYSGGVYPMMNDNQKKAIDARVAAVNTPWFRFFLTYDPAPTLTKVACPVLALNGSKDVQVPADENLEAIEKALSEGGNKHFKILKPENLNHLFQHCKTGAISEYAEIEETFSPEILELITEWILKTCSG